MKKVILLIVVTFFISCSSNEQSKPNKFSSCFDMIEAQLIQGDTSQIIWAKDDCDKMFDKEQKFYLGMTSNDTKESLSYHLGKVLSGSNYSGLGVDVYDSDKGYAVLSACRNESCDEKGMLYLDFKKQKSIAVIRHFFFGDSGFDRNGNLFIFSNNLFLEEFPDSFNKELNKWINKEFKNEPTIKYRYFDKSNKLVQKTLKDNCDELRFLEYKSSQFRADLKSYALRFESENISSNSYRLLSAESGNSFDLPISLSIEFVKSNDSLMYLNLSPPDREQYYSESNLEKKQWWEYVDSNIFVSVVGDVNNVTMQNSSQFEFSRNKFTSFHNFRLKGNEVKQTNLFAQKLLEYEAEPNSGLIILFKIDEKQILLIVPLCVNIENLNEFL